MTIYWAWESCRNREKLAAYEKKRRALVNQGKSEEVLALCREAQKEFPNEPEVIFNLMYALNSADAVANSEEMIACGQWLLQHGDAIDIVQTYHEKADIGSERIPVLNWISDIPPTADRGWTLPAVMNVPIVMRGTMGGACSFFHREQDKDVIVVCFCEALRIDSTKRNQNSTNGCNDV